MTDEQHRRLLTELAGARDDVRGLQAQVASLQDDVRVLSAMATRQDNNSKATLDLLRSLVSQPL